MKNLVKNAGLLGLDAEKLATLETRAKMHQRYSNITFKVVSCSGAKIVISVVQEKPFSGNAFDAKRLVEIGKETFGDLGAWTIHAGPIPYQPAPPEVVTPEWIRMAMAENGLKVKDLSRALGVDANTISAYKNGVKPLSGVVRAMFYYYLNPKQK